METPQESPKTDVNAEVKPDAKPEVTPEATTEVKPEVTPEVKPSKKARFGSFCLDFALVAMTASLIGGSAWYLNKQLKTYHIPTALELAMEENTKLAQKQQELEEEAFLADRNKRLKLLFKQMQDKLTQLDQEVAKKKGELKSAQGQILACQHQIRQADRDARNLAINQLLPGMMVGVIRTKNGQVYNGAIIRGIDGKKITVRHDSGQARFNLNLLETNSLPPIVRYALGVDKLVDTSDFISSPETKPTEKAAPKEAAKTAQNRGRIVTQSYASYDPKPGVPVVDSARQSKTSNTGNATAPSSAGSWDAPDDPLPL